MSWLRVERDDLSNTKEVLGSHGIQEGDTYKVYEPGWNSIVTGKQYRSMPFVLLLFTTDSAETMARMVL